MCSLHIQCSASRILVDRNDMSKSKFISGMFFSFFGIYMPVQSVVWSVIFAFCVPIHDSVNWLIEFARWCSLRFLFVTVFAIPNLLKTCRPSVNLFWLSVPERRRSTVTKVYLIRWLIASIWVELLCPLYI